MGSDARKIMRAIYLGIILWTVPKTVKTLTAPDEFQKDIGASLSELTSPIFYTEFVPILYELGVPQWEGKDLRVKWPEGHSTTCNDSNTHEWTEGAGCVSVFDYNSIISFYFNYTSIFWESFSKISQIQLDAKFCDEIKSHFQGFKSQMDIKTWDAYWKSLKSCTSGEIHHHEHHPVLLELTTTDSAKFDLMLESFYENLNLDHMYHDHNSDAAVAIYTNAYSAYQSVPLLFHYVDMDFWDQLMSDCSDNRFHVSSITTNFDETLRNLSGNLERVKSQLSIPETHLHFYESLPLADCTYLSENKSYVVRILAPTKPAVSDFKLFQLQTIPFVLDFDTSLENNLVCSLDVVEGKYIYDKSTNFIAKTYCKSNELCLVSKSHSWVEVDSCISAIFSKDQQNALKFCNAKCTAVNTQRFPLIKRLSSDKYVVVGHSKSQLGVFVICHGLPLKVIAPNVNGALEVQLPCDCKIIYDSQEYKAHAPCGNDLVTKNLTQMVNIKERVENPSQTDMELYHLELQTLKIHIVFLWIFILFLVIVLAMVIFMAKMQMKNHCLKSDLGNERNREFVNYTNSQVSSENLLFISDPVSNS